MSQLNDPNAAVSTERVFPASPRQIFAAFEQPDRLAQWWGPERRIRNPAVDFLRERMRGPVPCTPHVRDRRISYARSGIRLSCTEAAFQSRG